MNQINLPETAVNLSKLGYGCASLMARLKLRESVTLLEEAFEAGITHFDVARSYGYGEAEKAVGAFVADKREQVTVTTKLGILPPKRSFGLDIAKSGARKLVRFFPGMRSALRSQAGQLVSAGNFSVEAAQQSLATSLRELKTSYVDILLLHECRYEDLSDDLLEFLNGCVKNGSVRVFGLATTPEETQRILSLNPAFAPVVQFPSNVFNSKLGYLELPPAHTAITHSVFNPTVTEHLRRFVLGTPEREQSWSERIGADLTEPAALSRLVLSQAAHANPRGAVVFSSLNVQHIRSNTQTVSEGTFSPEQLGAFEHLVREFQSETR